VHCALTPTLARKGAGQGTMRVCVCVCHRQAARARIKDLAGVMILIALLYERQFIRGRARCLFGDSVRVQNVSCGLIDSHTP
jgi:hypothetical protein